MIVSKKQKTQSLARGISGLICVASFASGLVGMGVLFAGGFSNTPLYWNSLWGFVGLLTIGIIGTRIHGIVWRR